MGICNRTHYGWILSLGIKGDAISLNQSQKLGCYNPKRKGC